MKAFVYRGIGWLHLWMMDSWRLLALEKFDRKLSSSSLMGMEFAWHRLVVLHAIMMFFYTLAFTIDYNLHLLLLVVTLLKIASDFVQKFTH